MKPLRVLHCPTMVGGHPQGLAEAEREVGLVSRSVAFWRTSFDYECDEVLFEPGMSRARRERLRWRLLLRAVGDFDIVHFNTHKTFSTPHGGGGPGSGPVGVCEKLVDFLPGPIVTVTFPDGEDETPLYVFAEPKKSIGRVKSFNGNFGMLVRAYTYMRVHGPEGLKANSMYAVLNANYLRVKLHDKFPVPYDRICMHEFVCQGKFEGSDVRALDVSKRLMDYNFHPPTNYFPLIVPEALMIEPTETESQETLDQFIDAMRTIADEAVQEPALLHNAPHHTPVKRLDEVKAAKDLVLCCLPVEFEQKATA